MGLLGTSQSEEQALRAAADSASAPSGTPSASASRVSMSHSLSSHYETASEFSSQEFDDQESVPHHQVNDQQSVEDDADTIQGLDREALESEATHITKEGVDVDADYAVAEPAESYTNLANLSENELNRIMTTQSSANQAGSLHATLTRSRSHGQFIDPNDLDWDSPEDKENPFNWPTWKKWFVTMTTAYTCLCISLGSSLYVEGVIELEAKFGVSQTLALSGLTFYLIGLALGPVFAAPLSEMIGRRNIYISSFPISMLFTMGVGLSQNIRSILVLRFLSGLVASPPMSIAGGTISDIWGSSPVDMAIAMAFFCAAPFLGPIIGPIVGGFAVESQGWRFTMWASLIFSGAVLPFLLLCPETYKLAILKKRAKKRGVKLVKQKIDFDFLKETLQTNLIRPLEMLFVEPIVGLTSIYIAFIFAVLFGFFEAFPIVFRGVYGMGLGVSGLPFIGVGIGLIIGVVVYVASIKMGVRKAAKAALKQKELAANGEDVEPEKKWVAPEKKLSTAAVGAVFLPISLFWLAWTSRKSIHWISPVLSGVPFGFGLIWVFFGVVLYYSMSFPPAYVASALAANNFLRYLLASVFPLFIVQMYEKLHIDWATSLLAFISLAMVPIPLAFMKYGARLREHSKYGYSAYFKKIAAAKAAAEGTAEPTAVASIESSISEIANATSDSDRPGDELEKSVEDDAIAQKA